ncbi:hypothetical protein MNBD_GAMMA01-1471 [hydrothermal vent metagenome]|uniref:HRDC domain-containing protein n=1 Tax=hydrothermal vent metagenome TaxID=652676 RepID=A0A3B0VIQ1_9ZZZZ
MAEIHNLCFNMQMITDYQWIDDNSEIEQLTLSLNATDEVAFDSEFERVSSYYPKPALFQLRIDDRYYLLDMKKISDHHIFTRLLNNVILHSGSEDLEILYNYNKQLPNTVFDTQIAASLCGYGLHFSYQNIVNELLGVELSKAHSRSDWMQRPLSKEQLHYALEDVAYLPEIKQILLDKLQSQNRESWYWHLMTQKLNAVIQSSHIDKTFVKMVKSNRFNYPQQQLLYSLLQWREQLAIKRDRPRQWMLKNDDIIKITLYKPDSEKKLIDKIGLYPKFVKYNAQSIFNLYKTAADIAENILPKTDKLSSQQGATFTNMKQQLNDRCTQLGISPALIINTADLKSLVAANKDLSSIDMWQIINQ